MQDNTTLQAPPIRACTISRDIEAFDLLIEDMESIYKDAWGDLHFDEVVAFLNQPESDTLEVVVIAINDADDNDASLRQLEKVIQGLQNKGIKIIAATEDLSSSVIATLEDIRVHKIIPYPFPEGALKKVTIELRSQQRKIALHDPAPIAHKKHRGGIFAVHGLAGGTGATTLAINLAWELADIDNYSSPSVCLLDFDLQFGAVASNLGIPNLETIYRLLLTPDRLNGTAFEHSLLTYKQKLQVLTAPSEIIQLDLITPEDIQKTITFARNRFDYVIIDMPSLFVQWSNTVLQEVDAYFTTLELDTRSIQNAVRFKYLFETEGCEVSKLHYVLNRAPHYFSWHRARQIKTLSDCLNAPINLQLPDAGKNVSKSNAKGLPLAQYAPKSALRKKIKEIADSIYKAGGNFSKFSSPQSPRSLTLQLQNSVQT